MYYCEICQQLANPGTTSYRIIVATRPAEYPYRLNAHRNPKTHRHRGRPNILKPHEVQLRLKELDGKRDSTDDIGGRGCEVARELTVCPTCAAAWRADHSPKCTLFRSRRE
jgi:hypothetical protein